MSVNTLSQGLYVQPEIDWMHVPTLTSELERLQELAYPAAPRAYLGEFARLVVDWFDGAHPGYQANDTSYHDIDHTLQVALCWSRLMVSRTLAGDEPRIDFELYRLGLIAVLFHDIGYLKRQGDTEGTGAKYTHIHEERGCEVVAEELPALGFTDSEIASIQRFIRCTGPRAVITNIPFASEAERIVGMAVCTADYLGQMSDPKYVDKLPGLFREFQENDEFRQIPPEKRLFPSAEALRNGTPYFWRDLVIPRLVNQCGQLYRWLAFPAKKGPNPYWEKVRSNIEVIENRHA